MNTTTPTPSLGPRLAALVDEVLDPPRDEQGVIRPMLRARQLAASAATVLTLVQIVIWLLIAIIGGHLDPPWWAWSAVAGGVAVGVLTVLDGPHPTHHHDTRSTR